MKKTDGERKDDMTTQEQTTKALPAHFMVSESDGGLYDTRQSNWSASPMRTNYSRTHGRIGSLADLKATLRAGAYAWPGGYPMALLTDDGAALCFKCARKEFRQIAWDFMNRCSTGWRVIGCDVNWEDSDCACAHCGRQIESAYGE